MFFSHMDVIVGTVSAIAKATNKKDSAKPLPTVVDRWGGGSSTQRPKGPFAVSYMAKATW